MGTRSLTRIYEDGQLLVQLYKQYDGYPSGWGKELAEYLSAGKPVNGYGGDAKLHQTWNGAGCLAASLIAKFKTGPGGLYIEANTDTGQEYEYEIHVNGMTVIGFDVYEIPWDADKRIIYHGTPENFNADAF